MFKIISAFIYCHVYMRKTNKMYLYLIILTQLNFPLNVLNKQVHHQEVIAVQAAYGISHAYMGCPAANRVNHIVSAAGHPTDA
jgi:adenosine/AMP kinase